MLSDLQNSPAHPAGHQLRTMTMTAGIHHITAISGEIDRTLDFYVRVLGLRLLKRTVNYDDPGTYHLYFGDEVGRPGTILTFFPWPGGFPGRAGLGQAAATAFLIPQSSLDFWRARLRSAGVAYEGPEPRFDEQALSLVDPDGLPVDLVARADTPPPSGEDRGGVAAEHAIRGFHGVTLWVNGDPGTRALLAGPLGFAVRGEEKGRVRLAGAALLGSAVDLLQVDGFPQAAGGTGTVHHVAFRAPDDAAQAEIRDQLWEAGIATTRVQDRQYFRSIYFREPGGVLFEVATDGPGFTTDETPADLGRRLTLPPWLEPDRARIEAALPPFPPVPVEVANAIG
jgi:glyoxalase family protein